MAAAGLARRLGGPRRLAAGAALLAGAAAAVAAAGFAARGMARGTEAVVVAATAPGFATGQRLGDAPISVPDGASLVFLLPTGQMVTVKGPYDGPPPSPAAGARAGGVGGLARLGGTDSSQIGGTRSIGGAGGAGAGARPAEEEAPATDPAALARTVPLDLYLATERGRYPTYRAGDRLRLVLQPNRDAHLYCWVRAGRGRLVPLYPTTAGEADAVPGGETLRLPEGDKGLRLDAGLDEASVRCLATGEPLAADIVDGFVGAGGRPLPAPVARRLDAALLAGQPRPGATEGAPEQGMALAQLFLKVEGR